MKILLVELGTTRGGRSVKTWHVFYLSPAGVDAGALLRRPAPQ